MDELRKQTSSCISCNNCTFNFNRDHPFALKPALDGLCDKALVTTPVDVIIGPLVGLTAYCQSWNEKAKAALPLLLSAFVVYLMDLVTKHFSLQIFVVHYMDSVTKHSSILGPWLGQRHIASRGMRKQRRYFRYFSYHIKLLWCT